MRGVDDEEGTAREPGASFGEPVIVDRIGREGEAICRTPHGEKHVPFALPGETVAIAADADGGELVRIEESSSDRVAPICAHFGSCGGCKLQHWRNEPYLAWKRLLVVEALASQGFAVGDLKSLVAPAIDAHGAGRRRVTFHARPEGSRMRTGFMRARSHEIIAIEACPILAPALAASARIASDIAEALARAAKPLDIAVTATEAGLDVSVRGHGSLDAAARDAAIMIAQRHDLARLSNHHEVIVEPRQPFVMIGACRVPPPPGAFLQATVLGEERLAGLVEEAVAGRRRIADLFCGLGPFALRLARKSPIRAYDTDAASVAALSTAARMTQGLKPIAVEARDLFRRPLLPVELEACDAVILDPPRQGALAQTRELVRAKLARIVYVSCNPSTFARDAMQLVKGGYRLEAVTPVDQFRYSAHVELVGVFGRTR